MTAIQWLENKIDGVVNTMPQGNILLVKKVLKQAKEMEKEQLKEMYLKGIENYDPTFNKICEHCYITSADWKSQTCTKCNHRINL